MCIASSVYFFFYGLQISEGVGQKLDVNVFF